MANRTIIIFERLTTRYKLLIKWHIFRKRRIYFLFLNNLDDEDAWIGKYLNKGHLEKISFDFTLGRVPGLYYDMAFDNVHIFFKPLKENAMVKHLNKLYGTTAINGAFMKILNERLARFYYLNFLLHKLKNAYPKSRIIFTPADYLELNRTDGCEIYDYQRFYKQAQKLKVDVFDTSSIKFSIYGTAISYLSAFKRKVHIIFKILSFLLWLYKIALINKFKDLPYKDCYKYAVMIVSPSRQFENKIQKVDFLIDDKCITKDNTIFLAYKKLSPKYEAYMNKNNLTYIDDINNFISAKQIRYILPHYFFLLLFFIRQNSMVLYAVLQSIYYYIKWQSFSEHIHVESLITYSDFSNQAIARNLLLQQNNSKIYYYVDSANFGFLFVKKGSPHAYRSGDFAFPYCDYLISPNEKISEYLKSCYFDFKFCKKVGFFWAEHLRLIKASIIKSDFIEELRQRGYKEGMKLIAVFDNNFHEEGSLYTYQDGIEFLNGILKLLEELPFVFVVLKEKKSRERYRQGSGRYSGIFKIYNVLERHPRCYCLQGFKSPAEIIAFNDLTVSFPFSSASLEALSARKKAFWYDAVGKFKDTFYDSVPGLVCHSYDEFKSKVYELLYSTNEREYNGYLDKFIKGKIEPYLDGKAITRFRELLTRTESKLEAQINNKSASHFLNL